MHGSGIWVIMIKNKVEKLWKRMCLVSFRGLKLIQYIIYNAATAYFGFQWFLRLFGSALLYPFIQIIPKLKDVNISHSDSMASLYLILLYTYWLRSVNKNLGKHDLSTSRVNYRIKIWNSFSMMILRACREFHNNLANIYEI